MKAIDLLRAALTWSDEGVGRIAADMRDAALITATPGAKGGDGNHTLWQLGHLAFIEGLLHHFIWGLPNPVEHWAPLFGTGTLSRPEAGIYPSFDEVLATFHSLRRQTIARLDQLGDSGLDGKPLTVPPGFEDVMTSVGHACLLLSIHSMVHYGQVADARRVAGRKPLM